MPNPDNIVQFPPALPADARKASACADAFLGLVTALQQSARAPIAEILAQSDPRRPGRTTFLILGRTAASVQDAIDTLMATVDPVMGGVPGHAQFMGPDRDGIGWLALGEVVVDNRPNARNEIEGWS